MLNGDLLLAHRAATSSRSGSGAGRCTWSELQSQDLHGFVLREVQRVSRSHGKAVVTALRSFLRFLLQRGAIQDRPWPARCLGWRHGDCRTCPSHCLPEQVEQLLACCDRSTPTGKRDYAILLLLARLGLAWRRGRGHDLGGSGLGAR